MFYVNKLMSGLARDRPVFHSEADFQHALAWRIHERWPNERVRLEYKPFPDEKMYLDLWLPKMGVALELKYTTQELNIEHEGETFALRSHSAQDVRRYDFLKDIQRLERLEKLSKRRAPQVGFAILLTNDCAYWKPPRRRHPNDEAFRLHKGQKKEGKMAWSKQAGSGTTIGRRAPICLKGSYSLKWKHYATMREGKYREFRYLAVQTVYGDRSGAK